MKLNHTIGFTLIELVMTMVLMAILIVLMSKIVFIPIENFSLIKSRSLLVSLADQSLYKMRREIERAVPNSVRVASENNSTGIEFFYSSNVLRYMSAASHDQDNPYLLDTRILDDQFHVVGQFFNSPQPPLINSNYYRIITFNPGYVISNMPVSSQNVYAVNTSDKKNVITRWNTYLTIEAQDTTALLYKAGEFSVKMNPKHQFSHDGPKRLAYFSSGAISYICDKKNNTLIRVDNYSEQETQSLDLNDFPLNMGNQNIVVQNINDCQFYWDNSRALLLVKLILNSNEKDNATIQLYDEIYAQTPQ